MLSNQKNGVHKKYLFTTTILFLISPSQMIRDRKNGYYIFKSSPKQFRLCLYRPSPFIPLT